ncbi:hypothetical protein Smp_156610 [Schistosoma mansoni]|nr:hypothetical protein Smp_156610 [Schistosoma mansoni]|eukprot:XP_018651871.1 hypothetical protein Smp_156610 [Schistosoma mansoni]
MTTGSSETNPCNSQRSSNNPIQVEGQLTNELQVNIKMIVNVSVFG